MVGRDGDDDDDDCRMKDEESSSCSKSITIPTNRDCSIDKDNVIFVVVGSLSVSRWNQKSRCGQPQFGTW
jgi:hypothetical protein